MIDPEDLHRTSGQTDLGHSAGVDTPFPQHLEYRSDPPAPLTRYASVPTEITAEIQRLRSEIADLRAQIAEAHARSDTADEAAKPCPASEPSLARAIPIYSVS
ncbi:hypothetical protein [Tropicimonas sp. IMCC6043]|uniref:hypothetical protein n=1 Tax=Tropicimonas sp. IMCC6043 TaxID=2510645 RepID=UPI00101BB1E1|nr:hypothetical protein [Tropicimonas sp. IMCC6043]RYH11991.1 hypothetical protein EU800_00005 [Tropicimonas sp. IMCC6043]